MRRRDRHCTCVEPHLGDAPGSLIGDARDVGREIGVAVDWLGLAETLEAEVRRTGNHEATADRDRRHRPHAERHRGRPVGDARRVVDPAVDQALHQRDPRGAGLEPILVQNVGVSELDGELVRRTCRRHVWDADLGSETVLHAWLPRALHVVDRQHVLGRGDRARGHAAQRHVRVHAVDNQPLEDARRAALVPKLDLVEVPPVASGRGDPRGAAHEGLHDDGQDDDLRRCRACRRGGEVRK
mmetsp:Transcript_62341/g.190537  ORF Transcript_62341/g.190537 Transcript_62341/m.190537 type:complete len:241 (+) Transcript_62341:4059-4781(+)